MNNLDYILLYGIAPSIANKSEEVLVQEYGNKPIELFTDFNYVRKLGEQQQSRLDKNTQVLTSNLNYIGILIRRCNVLNSISISEIIEAAYNKGKIKNHIDEITFIKNYCLANNIGVFRFPSKYKEIDKKLSTLKIVSPSAIVIADTSIIVDTAIGIADIEKMIKTVNEQSKRINQVANGQTSKESTTDALSKLAKSTNIIDIMKAFDR